MALLLLLLAIIFAATGRGIASASLIIAAIVLPAVGSTLKNH